MLWLLAHVIITAFYYAKWTITFRQKMSIFIVFFQTKIHLPSDHLWPKSLLMLEVWCFLGNHSKCDQLAGLWWMHCTPSGCCRWKCGSSEGIGMINYECLLLYVNVVILSYENHYIWQLCVYDCMHICIFVCMCACRIGCKHELVSEWVSVS